MCYIVKIYKRGRITHWVDGRDPCRSNWLRYINCASSVESQNMTAFQTGGDIYYRTVQTIRPNTELLVWYGDDYATELGLISVSFTKSLNLITLCEIISLISVMSIAFRMSILLNFQQVSFKQGLKTFFLCPAGRVRLAAGRAQMDKWTRCLLFIK